MSQHGKSIVFCMTALLVLALSQLSSYLIAAHLAIGETQVLTPFLYFTHVRNLGGTFGVLQGHSTLFALLSTVLIAVCSVAFLRSKPAHWIQALLFGFIIGGGAANVVDRLVRGSVVDFINVQGIPHWQYVFNTADVFIHLGIWPTLLIAYLQSRKETAGNAPFRALAILAALAATGGSHAAEILAYRVTLQPDFAQHAISGITRIVLDPRSGPDLRLPLHDLQVSTVELDGAALPYRIADGQLSVSLPNIQAARAELRIAYHGAPREGLNFGADYVNSAWQGCDWMICDEDPAKKAPLTLELLLPSGYISLASGVPVGKERIAPDLVRHTWREERPYSSYLYGFAAGRFHHVQENAGNIALHYYGINDDEAALRRRFAPSAGMLAFLQDKSGVAMPHGAYRQLLIPGSEAQELSAFSVIGNDELDPMQADPQEDWAIVHEMAHQWWGNLLTCKTWSEFWLNEGITTFMVAAYKEQRWGHEAYAHELALQRKRYQNAIDAGYDQPLAYAGSYPSLKIRRAIQYAKGALFMESLRSEIGDRAFWNGLRRYTQAHVGGSVTSRDLQTAMEQAAGRKLAPLFDKWVY